MASNSNSGGGFATGILTTLCCLWLCREANRSTETVTVVEETTVVRPGGRRVRRTKRYKNRDGFYDDDNNNTVIVVRGKAGSGNGESGGAICDQQVRLPLVACTHHPSIVR